MKCYRLLNRCIFIRKNGATFIVFISTRSIYLSYLIYFIFFQLYRRVDTTQSITTWYTYTYIHSNHQSKYVQLYSKNDHHFFLFKINIYIILLFVETRITSEIYADDKYICRGTFTKNSTERVGPLYMDVRK